MWMESVTNSPSSDILLLPPNVPLAPNPSGIGTQTERGEARAPLSKLMDPGER